MRAPEGVVGEERGAGGHGGEVIEKLMVKKGYRVDCGFVIYNNILE